MLAPDLPTLVAARALQGAGTAAGMVVGRALVQDLFQGAERTRVMAFVGMAMGLCPPTAILLGGQLHVRLGWQANFALVAGLAALLAVAAWRGLPASRPASATPGTSAPVPWARAMAQAYARLARERNFVLYVCILAMATATFYAFLAGAPLVLAGSAWGPTAWAVHHGIPLSYIGGNYLTTRLAQAVGDRALMRWGQGLSVAGLLLLLALAGAGLHTALAFAAPWCCWASGMAC
jgi:DHA1 family bicyclomycin/chloramphenicol resistance-like MFS transporter